MPPDALILSFDTSAAHCAAALLRGSTLLAERFEPMQRGQAERLFVLLEEMLAEGGAAWRDITAVAVGIGPGNFTGIRIAVAAARGLALSLDCPAIGVSGFKALAEGQTAPVLASVDARRGQAYVQMIGAGTPHAPVIATPADFEPPEEARGALTIGHMAETFATATGGRATEATFALAVAIARVAARRLHAASTAGKAGGADIPPPAPLYLRGADATPPAAAPPVILP